MLLLVCCCAVDCHLCVVGCVSVVFDALSVVWSTQTTCHVNDGVKKRYLYSYIKYSVGDCSITVFINAKTFQEIH